ncbi:hypothetical protein [Mycobacterium sp. AT1]|nr:hypothetical protein [Mycobacterium sp. AT1]
MSLDNRTSRLYCPPNASRVAPVAKLLAVALWTLGDAVRTLRSESPSR